MALIKSSQVERKTDEKIVVEKQEMVAEKRVLNRVTLLDKKKGLFETIIKHVREGGRIEHAAEKAGITRKSIHEWVQIGKNPEHPLWSKTLGRFAKEFQMARAEFAIESHKILVREAHGILPPKVEGVKRKKVNFQALQLLLRSVDPGIYSPQALGESQPRPVIFNVMQPGSAMNADRSAFDSTLEVEGYTVPAEEEG